MAQAENPTVEAESFSINPTEHLPAELVDDETPRNVHVEISSNGRYLMAILAAGEAGRWSFDFRVEGATVKIVRGYEEGMRIDPGKLPAWAEPVSQRVEELLEV